MFNEHTITIHEYNTCSLLTQHSSVVVEMHERVCASYAHVGIWDKTDAGGEGRSSGDWY